MITVPLTGAVHDHHTEAPPELPAWFGSPACFVVWVFVASSVIGAAPLMVTLLEKSSCDVPSELTVTATVRLTPLMMTLPVVVPGPSAAAPELRVTSSVVLAPAAN